MKRREFIYYSAKRNKIWVTLGSLKDWQVSENLFNDYVFVGYL